MVVASTIVWLVLGIFLAISCVPVTLIIGRRVRDPERLVALIDDAVARRRDSRDPDARRAGMHLPVVVIPGYWFLALFSWPRTIDHLIRGEWNVITSGPESEWSNIVSNAILGGFALCVLLGFSIYYWNQPKFLVHPYFHGDPGLLKARRLRARGVDVDEMYEASAERWRERRRRRR